MPHPLATDFRSDTITWPSRTMYDAMASAKLGDDVFGDDPTVRSLEERVAQMLGKEAALLVPSGTMANNLALAVSTRPGDEVLVAEDSHVYLFEQGASARLWGVQARPLPARDACVTVDQIREHHRPDGPHFPRTALVCVENTHNMQGGRVVSVARLEAIGEVCRELGMRLHLDGARLFNAAVASGRAVAEFAAAADTVTVGLSKGLHCPVGSVLAGDVDTIAAARRVRQLLGGGMRQAGILAACGLVALDEQIARLAEDHRRTRELGDRLRRIRSLRIRPEPPETNILLLELEDSADGDYATLVASLERQGVRVVNILNRALRLVVHGHVDDDAVVRAAATIESEVGALKSKPKRH